MTKTFPSSPEYSQPIAPDGSATIHITELGMPSPFLCGVREYGFEYYAALQEAAQAMRLGMEGGRDPVNGVYREPRDPCDILQSIIYSTFRHAGGLVDTATFPPMQETERTGKGVTVKDRLRDMLGDFLDGTADDLRTGEGLCFCLDGAWSERTIARTVNRIDAMYAEEVR